RVETIKFTPPKIVSTPVTDIPPPVDKLDNVTISDVTEKGEKTDAVNPPPEPKGTGAKEIRVSETPPGTIMVQVLAAFPGGAKAWKKYLERNLRQDVPVENGAPAGDYKVVVSFIVNADGTLSNIKAENDPGYGVAGEAVRVVQKSGKWVPAIQNGRYVTYRQQQPITFRVTVEQQ
ncbi:MAG TPA: energy transducer TonB, partial [Chitinophagaceae bacterium]|nr:energy transducer TonB [Chitinophagaceae bacterium]